MRSRIEIEEELSKAREELELVKEEVEHYNGDRGTEYYLFLSAVTQKLNASQDSVRKLEEELAHYSEAVIQTRALT